ncbi:MAG: type II toxin-antitoxin system HicA family toxin [Candidatus Poribacteria bacterium]
MKQISGKKLAKLLEKCGWRLIRTNGSHHTYKNQNVKEMITISIHGNKPIKIGILKQVMKIAEISEDELK